MIDNTVGGVNSLEKKIQHLETRFSLKAPQTEKLLEAHNARNAIVHNSGRVNRHRSSTARWQLEDIIELTADDVALVLQPENMLRKSLIKQMDYVIALKKKVSN